MTTYETTRPIAGSPGEAIERAERLLAAEDLIVERTDAHELTATRGPVRMGDRELQLAAPLVVRVDDGVVRITAEMTGAPVRPWWRLSGLDAFIIGSFVLLPYFVGDSFVAGPPWFGSGMHLLTSAILVVATIGPSVLLSRHLRKATVGAIERLADRVTVGRPGRRAQ